MNGPTVSASLLLQQMRTCLTEGVRSYKNQDYLGALRHWERLNGLREELLGIRTSTLSPDEQEEFISVRIEGMLMHLKTLTMTDRYIDRRSRRELYRSITSSVGDYSPINLNTFRDRADMVYRRGQAGNQEDDLRFPMLYVD